MLALSLSPLGNRAASFFWMLCSPLPLAHRAAAFVDAFEPFSLTQQKPLLL